MIIIKPAEKSIRKKSIIKSHEQLPYSVQQKTNWVAIGGGMN